MGIVRPFFGSGLKLLRTYLDFEKPVAEIEACDGRAVGAPCELDPESGCIYPAQAHFAQKNGGGFRSRYFTDFVEVSLAVCPQCQRHVCRLLPGLRGKEPGVIAVAVVAQLLLVHGG